MKATRSCCMFKANTMQCFTHVTRHEYVRQGHWLMVRDSIVSMKIYFAGIKVLEENIKDNC